MYCKYLTLIEVVLVSNPEESKAARHERIKGEKNPWEMLPEIYAYAPKGIDAVPEEDFNTRLRWWGLYPQGDGEGVKGGTDPYFMLRIRIPGGILTSTQFRLIGSISERFARGTADVTVRQNIQLHWLRIEDIPEIFQTLFEAGLTSMGACGDDTRNITTCPVSDLDPDPSNNLSDLVLKVTKELNGNPLFYNLPRKFKITLSGCATQCTYPEINDIGITPVIHGDGRKGFKIQVAGGLSTRPHFAVPLNVFLGRDQIVPVVRGVACLFRDREELRQKRERARLKFLFLDHGWDRNRFEEELRGYIDFPLEPWVPIEEGVHPAHTVRDHMGFFSQVGRERLHYVGLPINQGSLNPELFKRISELSESCGDGHIRLTPQQNVVMTGISYRKIEELKDAMTVLGIPLDSHSFLSRTVSCTGKTYCRLALVETKSFARSMAETLDRKYPTPTRPINIHVTGCPNDCGQQRIAEIGLQGGQFKDSEGTLRDGFDLFLGGQTGTVKAFNSRVGIRLDADHATKAISDLIEIFESESEEEEDFRSFVLRIGTNTLKERIAPKKPASKT